MTAFLAFAITIAYFSLLISISIFTSKKTDNDSFFTGNRNSNWLLVSFGMIGASLSGVTFVSVPGWVRETSFTYLQTVFGYFIGYVVVAVILIPLYYKLNLTSIYSYLNGRFDRLTQKVGAMIFLFSRVLGAAFRLYLVVLTLQFFIFEELGIPPFITVLISITLIWVYTYKGGIKTVVFTDVVQTTFMLAAMLYFVYFLQNETHTTISGLMENSKAFNFESFLKKDYFLKNLLGGAFIAITMTGLDQDMMQKNLTCKNSNEAAKNMIFLGFSLILVNALFLLMGWLLIEFAQQNNVALPERGDLIFPFIAKNHSGLVGGTLFLLGILAAAYSSADSALTSLTTSFSVDFLKGEISVKTRTKIHIAFSFILFLVVVLFMEVLEASVIGTLLQIASYTYGPLLGLFCFGILSKRQIKSKLLILTIPASIGLVFLFATHSKEVLGGYEPGLELLILNGAINTLLLFIISNKKPD